MTITIVAEGGTPGIPSRYKLDQPASSVTTRLKYITRPPSIAMRPVANRPASLWTKTTTVTTPGPVADRRPALTMPSIDVAQGPVASWPAPHNEVVSKTITHPRGTEAQGQIAR